MTRRAELIATEAARLFAQRGFGATTIDDIGEAAGVSGPAIYWHYQGKQALLGAMLTEVSERLLDGGHGCIAAATSDEDALIRLVEAQVAFALAEPDLIVVHARELHHLDPEQAHTVRLLQRQYLDLWVSVLQSLNPGTPPATLSAAAQAAIGLINSTPYLGRTGRGLLQPLLQSMALASLGTLTTPPTPGEVPA